MLSPDLHQHIKDDNARIKMVYVLLKLKLISHQSWNGLISHINILAYTRDPK